MMAYADLAVGQKAEFSKTVTEADVVLFAGVTGDFNSAHVDEVQASKSRFKGRIAHGLLSAGFISACIAMRLPGPGSIYLSQSLRFVRPVRIGDTVTAGVEIAELIPAKRRIRLTTQCHNQMGELVIDGEAMIQMPDEESGVAG
jgi:3-hydroxybutyryl-CoA dehydratase